MNFIRKYSKALKYITYNTLRFNFQYFPFNTAIKFPVFISSKTVLKEIKGELRILNPIKTGMVKIGYDDISIFDKKKNRAIWSVTGKVFITGNCNIGHGSKINVGEKGILKLGNNFTITAESSIISNNMIKFGNDCLLSWDILIMDDDFHKIYNKNDEIINFPKEIIVGNKVWIGCRSIILKGSNIPDNSIIAAGSIVTKSLKEENVIYGGNPLRIINEEINWEK